MARAIKLINAPAGLFDIDGVLVLKTEYSTQHEDGAITPDCYIVDSGEYFWGGVDSVEERNNLMVTPIDMPTLTPPNEVASIINRLPAADVAPIVHAKWENNKNEYPECTNCGYMPAYDPAIDDINYSPYCPNCGAKMDGEEIEKQREKLKKKEQIMRDAQLIARDLGFVIRAGDYRTALRVVESFGRDENK